jgi:hypothetical protein
MKTKVMVFLSVVALLACTNVGHATTKDPGSIFVDTVFVRPACIVSTVVGSALFVVALPFSAASKTTKATSKALIALPAHHAFKRPLGDLEDLGM